MVGQKNASFVGFGGSRTSDACGKCHREAAETFLETQHAYLISPFDPTKYFTEIDEAGVGNASADALTALDAVYDALIADGYVGRVNALHVAGDNLDTVTSKDILTVGLIPLGNKSVRVSREIVVRNKYQGVQQFTVIGAMTWNATTKAWTVDASLEYLPLAENYEKCFTCHATLVKTDVANVASKATLAAWYAYLDNKYVNPKPAGDLGVTCEACHGEASNHVKQPMATNIFNPASSSLKNQSRICGRCHVSSANINGYTEGYTPWKLADTTAFDTPVTNGLGTFANNSVLMAAYFDAYAFAAGDLKEIKDYTAADKASTTNFLAKDKTNKSWAGMHHGEYPSFTASKHWQGASWNSYQAALSCGSCHDAHSEKISAAQLKVTEKIICQTCHGTDLTPEEFMPRSDFMRYHDFGVLYKANKDGGTWYNSTLNQAKLLWN